MPCPHAGGGDRRGDRGHGDRPDGDGEVSRRGLIRAAVAFGGASGLAACLGREREATPTPTEAAFPQGPTDLSTLPERQHAWVEFLVRDRFGNTALPQHHAMLMLEYTGEIPPGEGTRERVEAAFRTLERAYQRGTGGDGSAVEHEGLLFAVGYSPSYFDRFDGALPDSVDLPDPETVLAELEEPDATADAFDAVVHLCSDAGSVVVAAERALFGDLDAVNGVAVEGGLDGVFELAERRTGFIGRGQPAQRYDVEGIPDSAPLSMGFKSGFRDNLPSEDQVTIGEGPFAGGTTMQVSRLEHDLEAWYDHDHGERTHRMFSPAHTSEEVGEVGEDLAAASGITEDLAENADSIADEEGVIGHGQKVARARDDDFRQRILRRDFDISDRPGMHFDSWQEGIEDFLDVRRAMNGDDIDADLDAEDDGILGVVDVTNRATFLMPPRSLRALPGPDPDGGTAQSADPADADTGGATD